MNAQAQALAVALRRAGMTRPAGQLLAAVEPSVRDATRSVMTGDVVDDIVQETLLRLTIRFVRWDPDKGEFPAWAATVAKNLAVNYLRRDHDALAVLGDDAEALADDAAIDAIVAVDDAALIDSVFDRLTARRDTQAQKVLAAVCDLVGAGHAPTHAAVAVAAGVSESTVRRALTRIRAVAVEADEEI